MALGVGGGHLTRALQRHKVREIGGPRLVALALGAAGPGLRGAGALRGVAGGREEAVAPRAEVELGAQLAADTDVDGRAVRHRVVDAGLEHKELVLRGEAIARDVEAGHVLARHGVRVLVHARGERVEGVADLLDGPGHGLLEGLLRQRKAG